ncbi:hypothetical protein ACWIUA_12295, partial [Ursidibacter sp. B-7004-1]
MNGFELKKRTALLKQNPYEEAETFFIKKKIKNIFSIVVPEYIQESGEQEINTYYRRLSWSQSSDHQEFVQLKYSAGIEIQEVVDETQSMLARFEKHFSQDFPDDKLYLQEA